MTKIAWTQETVNPFAGCTKASEGCRECYAEKMARRLAAMGQKKYSEIIDQNGKWNGKTVFDASALEKIFNWKNPRMIFMVSMGDLFHEYNDNDDIAMVFAAMYLNQRHTFQVLTKRPERAETILKSEGFWISYHKHCNQLHDKFIKPLEQELYFYDEVKQEWPLKNVWFGVTAENQQKANERIPILMKIPAAKRFVSIEPMLGTINLTSLSREEVGTGTFYDDSLTGFKAHGAGGWYANKLDWVICGCESGPKRRPFEFDWAVSLRDQCIAANVPFFFKQRYIGNKKVTLPTIDCKIWNQVPEK